MSIDREDDLVHCGDHLVRRSEVTVDDEGREIHGRHYFPSGISRGVSETPHSRGGLADIHDFSDDDGVSILPIDPGDK